MRRPARGRGPRCKGTSSREQSCSLRNLICQFKWYAWRSTEADIAAAPLNTLNTKGRAVQRVAGGGRLHSAIARIADLRSKF